MCSLYDSLSLTEQELEQTKNYSKAFVLLVYLVGCKRFICARATRRLYVLENLVLIIYRDIGGKIRDGTTSQKSGLSRIFRDIWSP